MSYEVEILTLPPEKLATLRFECDAEDFSEMVEQGLTELWTYLELNGSGPAGNPASWRLDLSGTEDEIPPSSPWSIETGFPILEDVPARDAISVKDWPGARVATCVHEGDLAKVFDAYLLLQSWIEAEGHEPAGAPWEVYLTDPVTQPDMEKWRTQVRWPIR